MTVPTGSFGLGRVKINALACRASTRLTLGGHAYHCIAARRNVLPWLMKRSLTKMAQESRPSPLQSPSSARAAFGHAFGDCGEFAHWLFVCWQRD